LHELTNQRSPLWRIGRLSCGDALQSSSPIDFGKGPEGYTLRTKSPTSLLGRQRKRCQLLELLNRGCPTAERLSMYGASDTTIESLEAAIMQSDFAILVLAPDDYVERRVF
jgi:hypothetical protein